MTVQKMQWGTRISPMMMAASKLPKEEYFRLVERQFAEAGRDFFTKVLMQGRPDAVYQISPVWGKHQDPRTMEETMTLTLLFREVG